MVIELGGISDGELEGTGNDSTFAFEENPRQRITQRAGGVCKCDKGANDKIGLFDVA